MVGEPSRTTTTEDPVKMGEVEMAGRRYGDGGGGCLEPGRDGGIELQEGRFWDVGLCTCVGGSGGVGVDGTDGLDIGGGVEGGMR